MTGRWERISCAHFYAAWHRRKFDNLSAVRHRNAKRERSSGEQHTYRLSLFLENSP